MIRGLYTAASGMLSEVIRNDATANNLANANTVGFKRDMALNRDFASILVQRIDDGPGAPAIGRMGLGTVVDAIVPEMTQGALREDGAAFDLALVGPGYFVVATPNGLRYTRNGNFSRSAQGELVTQDGWRVMGRNGPVLVNGNTVKIGADGRVFVDGVYRDTLEVVDFPAGALPQKEGALLYTAPPGVVPQPATARVQQGYLETSNVNVVTEMVNMIDGYRAYEANAKMVQTQDALLDKAVNEVGKVV